MSSIYRKGRDGYFYYQTYVLDDNTGKKNKRIFHSLGTKELTEAEKKQKMYDLKYFRAHKNTSNPRFIFIKKNLKSLFLIITTSIITLQFSYLIDKKNQNKIYNDSMHKLDSKENHKIFIPQEINSFDNVDTNKKMRIEANNLKDQGELSTIGNTKKFQIPKYKIERIERLAGAFEAATQYYKKRPKICAIDDMT